MKWLDRTKTALIDVSSVDLEDTTYLIPSWLPLDPLLHSIQAVGILNPPLVQARDHEAFIPVLGRRRLAAAQQLGHATARVRIASADMPESEGAQIAFWDNVAGRGLGPGAAAFVVRRLLELFPRREVADRFLPVLGIKPQGPRLERSRAIGGLEFRLLEALDKGQLQEKTAALLANLSSHERLQLFDLTQRLKLNANKTAEVISHLIDLAVFTRVSLADILANARISKIVDDEERPAPDRAAELRALVRQWKFPELVRREREFRDRLKAAAVPAHVNIRPTANFEDERSTVEIDAESWEEVEMIIRAVHNMRGES